MRSWTTQDAVGLVVAALLGLLMVAGWQQSVGIGVFGLGLLAFAVLAATISFLRDHRLSAPPATLTALSDVPATVVRREHVAFFMGLLVLTDFVAVSTAWSVLAIRDSPPFAVVFALPAVWAICLMALVARQRFTAGSLWFTPEQLVYRSRGLHLSVRWDDIISADGDAVPALAVLYARDETSITHSNVPKPWRSERLASPEMAVIRTDDMSVDPGTLVRFIGRYALDPAARHELGTPASLEVLESVRLTSSSGPLPNAFVGRRPGRDGT